MFARGCGEEEWGVTANGYEGFFWGVKDDENVLDLDSNGGTYLWIYWKTMNYVL